MLSQALFNPGVNNLLARLDDSKSMFSIAIRDGVDSSGRTIMEYKRNPHGGRERLIEDFLTTIIWGFGINFIKNRIYDPIVKKAKWVQKPDLDMDLLLEKNPQALSKDMVRAFSRKFNEPSYRELAQVLESSALKQKYHLSNVLKFGIATAIPVLLIAFGIPTFNQWLTRKKSVSQAPLPGRTHPALQPSFRKPTAFQAFGANPAGGDHSFNHAAQAQSPFTAGSQVRFNGLGTTAALGASTLLQNERYNTLLVDGVLSGGRIYKARNWTERGEIIFREGSIIFFLYFARKFIQEHISKLIDKLFKTDSKMEFKAIRHLHDAYGNDNARLLRDFHGSRNLLKTEIPQLANLGAYLDGHRNLAELEKPVTDLIRRLFLEERTGEAKLLLETAKKCGWLPVLKDGAYLDLSRKIQVEPMLRFLHQLEGAQAKLRTEVLNKALKGNMAARFGAMMLANAVCTLFLSYICPKIQHWLTYKKTGKNYFPGVNA